MKFTAHSDCATEGLEERIDHYDNIVDKDIHVRECLQRIEDKIGCIRNALTRCCATPKEMEALNDLDDEITGLQTEMITLLAGEAHDETYIAYHVGVMFGQLRERRNRDDQEGGRRHE